MEIEFYDVKTRKKVLISQDLVKKVQFRTKGVAVRYGLRARTVDGRNLTKFVSKGYWERFPGDIDVG